MCLTTKELTLSLNIYRNLLQKENGLAMFCKSYLIKNAIENIVCYKMLYNKHPFICESTWFNFKWFPFKKYKTQFGIVPRSRVDEKTVFVVLDINEGFHSFIKNNYIAFSEYIIPCIMVIPKGSLYYINDEDNEMVSDQLMLIGRDNKFGRLKLKIYQFLKR